MNRAGQKREESYQVVVQSQVTDLWSISGAKKIHRSQHKTSFSLCILTVHTQNVTSMSKPSSIRHSQSNARGIFIPRIDCQCMCTAFSE